jgi:cytochrome P450 family 97 subfamily B polypeptide 3
MRLIILVGVLVVLAFPECYGFCPRSVLGRNQLHLASHLRMRPDTLKMAIFEGNPLGKWAWDQFWKLDLVKPGKQGTSPTNFGDAALVIKNNILQVYGGEPSPDGAPIAEGAVEGVLEGSLFLALKTYFEQYGGVFKLLFGPKSFIVISDPSIAKHILKTNAAAYDKGVLAEILEPIMGQGLIPANPEIWKARRRAIVPGFHKKWYNRMCSTFVECNGPLVDKLENAVNTGETLNMETEFCSVSLDIIGKAVFNYEFGSVTNESPVIQSVYSALKEAEHRSITPLPYWNIIPFANQLIPRLRKFNKDLRLLDGVLDELITNVLQTRNEEDVEALENRDYDNIEDPSLLRFLVDMRGEDVSSKVLRDDLMTMLIAGHETTAAVLTWAIFELSQQPELMKRVQSEIDNVVGDRDPTFEDIKELGLVRRVIAESLRMYPEPPLLIRRALQDDVLPAGGVGFETKIQRGTDIFLALYNIHRCPDFWENPDHFDPDRFTRPFKNANRPDWEGFTPADTMYPNESNSDFAFLPFGGGSRKCVGDQFACMEAVVTLCMVLRDYDLSLDIKPEDVGIYTGATIHTRNGLMMKVKKRLRGKHVETPSFSNEDVKDKVHSTVQ